MERRQSAGRSQSWPAINKVPKWPSTLRATRHTSGSGRRPVDSQPSTYFSQ